LLAEKAVRLQSAMRLFLLSLFVFLDLAWSAIEKYYTDIANDHEGIKSLSNIELTQ